MSGVRDKVKSNRLDRSRTRCVEHGDNFSRGIRTESGEYVSDEVSAAAQAQMLAEHVIKAVNRGLAESSLMQVSSLLSLMYGSQVHLAVRYTKDLNEISVGMATMPVRIPEESPTTFADAIDTLADANLLGADFETSQICTCEYVPTRIFACTAGTLRRVSDNNSVPYCRQVTIRWGPTLLDSEAHSRHASGWHICEEQVVIFC